MLFVFLNKEEKYKIFDGEFVKFIWFEFLWEVREFIVKYENVENFCVYGYERYVY